jgi:hypothetical protein
MIRLLIAILSLAALVVAFSIISTRFTITVTIHPIDTPQASAQVSPFKGH